jgi:hypothetical protein
MTARDVHKIVNDLAQGNVLLTEAQKTEMFTGFPGLPGLPGCLGWDCSVRPDCPDPYVCKNGGLLQRDVALFTYAGILKCNVPVVVYVNSFLPAPYQPWDTSGNSIANNGDIIGLVKDAYSSAVTISYPGAVSPGKGNACIAR